MYVALYHNSLKPHAPIFFLHCSIGFLGFSQKPPGGLIPTARRLIRGGRMFLFWFESPGGDEFLPGGATLVAFWLMVFMLIWLNIVNCGVANDFI